MFTTVSCQLPTDTMLRLVQHLARRGGTQDISESITAAVESWLAAESEAPPAADPAGVRGYQWKTLFLPEGTVLRSWSYGEHNYACVEGDQIMHEGRSVSPNQFARSFARTARNAWFDLSVRRPGDKHFKIACRLRQELAQEELAHRRSRLAGAEPGPPPATATPPSAEAAAATSTTSLAVPAERAPVSTAPQPRPEPPEPRRHKQDFDPGWDLPERRKFRYRAEDIAY
ncbi:hypothetical protein [Duganella aceris]|uniref:DUF2924 domain-containing protein n=1 Tax=Duganella aceris TaxID=2703883 RepID=A0ABX0FEG5_9BURK|nr:hypothetical protein [Duganella aceris]NGZ82686.1 hypothetical protein [Duganella aceris]